MVEEEVGCIVEVYPKKLSDGQDEGHEKRGGENDSKVILNLDNLKVGESRGCVIFWLKLGNSLGSVS